jgi:hypothetical protein
MDDAKLEEATATEDEQLFYRLAKAKELGFSTAELEHRRDLTDQIVRNLEIIRQADVDEIGPAHDFAKDDAA